MSRPASRPRHPPSVSPRHPESRSLRRTRLPEQTIAPEARNTPKNEESSPWSGFALSPPSPY